ncbi:MAG: hypothetical protein H6826_00170 [Planctomycetes bacterium]|nr:hypothetical protein [Planctomycetota bacterium]
MEPLFRPYTPDQHHLLPPSLRDWLAEDHLAYFISDTVDDLDLGAFLARYRTQGAGTIPTPALMSLLLSATPRCSPRKIAGLQTAWPSVCGRPADHRTLARFPTHLSVEDLFRQVVRWPDAGLWRWGP